MFELSKDLKKQLYPIIEKGYADDIPTDTIIEQILALLASERQQWVEEAIANIGERLTLAEYLATKQEKRAADYSAEIADQVARKDAYNEAIDRARAALRRSIQKGEGDE